MKYPLLVLLTAALVSMGARANPWATDDPKALEAWFDAQDELIERALNVNEGELTFLSNAPETPVHHHSNRLTIDAGSLVDGWVQLRQCHTGLDPVGQAQILFRPEALRALKITGTDKISRAWVEDYSVQMEDIRHGASLCLEAETRALHDLGGSFFEMRNGPYMRRFLDGYYPMRITLDISYPDDLELVDYSPEYQPGFRPRAEAQRITVDAWFEGRLHTSFRFTRREVRTH